MSSQNGEKAVGKRDDRGRDSIPQKMPKKQTKGKEVFGMHKIFKQCFLVFEKQDGNENWEVDAVDLIFWWYFGDEYVKYIIWMYNSLSIQ